jgi:REP element-mobilizing transposase RayT
MSRGNARQAIFLDDRDRRHFLRCTAAALRRFRVRCHAYCLMPNHFHLILRVADAPLAGPMQQLESAYANRFNSRHRRIGHLFQGRYQALMIEDGGYFRRALRYVARNPVRAGLVADPAEWMWSSYRATADRRVPRRWLALDEVWAAFHDDRETARRAFVDYCGHADVTEDDTAPTGPLVFGSAACAAGLSDGLTPHRRHREFVYAERFADRPPLCDLFAGDESQQRRQRAIRRAFDDHGYTLREIADFLGVAPTTVWRHARGLVQGWRQPRTRKEKIKI